MSVPSSIRRIPEIALPEVRRESWVSPAARASWQPRLDELRDGNRARAHALVARGEVEAVLLRVAPDRVYETRVRAEDDGLAVLRLAGEPPPGVLGAPVPSAYGSARRPAEQLVVGARAATKRLSGAAATGDWARVRTLLGVPSCCARFHDAHLRGWRSPWWPVARATATRAGPVSGHVVVCAAGAPAALLLFELGIAWIWYAPCGFDCDATAARDHSLRATLPPGERGTLEAVQDWPVEWSGLHAIAEIKTPVVKLLRPADPTVEKLVVRLRGRAGAPEVEAAARGVRFPFARRRRR